MGRALCPTTTKRPCLYVMHDAVSLRLLFGSRAWSANTAGCAVNCVGGRIAAISANPLFGASKKIEAAVSRPDPVFHAARLQTETFVGHLQAVSHSLHYIGGTVPFSPAATKSASMEVPWLATTNTCWPLTITLLSAG
jgi:hypothetical protein